MRRLSMANHHPPLTPSSRYDMSEDSMKSRMMMCLVVSGGKEVPKEMLKVAASKMAAKMVAKRMVTETGAKVAAKAVTSWLPIGAVYELLVADSPSVAQRACQVHPDQCNPPRPPFLHPPVTPHAQVFPAAGEAELTALEMEGEGVTGLPLSPLKKVGALADASEYAMSPTPLWERLIPPLHPLAIAGGKCPHPHVSF